MGMRLYGLLLLAISACAGAAPRTVAELTISETGGTIDPEAAEICKIFKPTAAQIKRYFLRAYPVESYVITTERYSPCYAAGKIRFSDRNMGEWWLYSGGTATLEWNRGGRIHLLYKRGNGWRDPFAGGYGLCDEREC